MTKPFPVDVSAGACITGCLLILLIPLELTFSFYLAAAIHEAGHILLLRFFRVPIWGISFHIGGATIQTAPVTAKEELLCAAAGPIASFLCAAFVRRFPLLGICALIQGIFNLLPLFPMDGGRILRCLCNLYCPRCTGLLCKAAAISSTAVILSFCMIFFLHTNELPYLFIAFYFLLQTYPKINTPCKELEY